MIELVMALVKIVIGKTADIVKHQFGIIGQDQAAQQKSWLPRPPKMRGMSLGFDIKNGMALG